MIPAWVGPYVGRPFRDPGHTCWDLVVNVYRDQWGIALPSYADHYASTMDRDIIASLVTAESGQRHWRLVTTAELQTPDVLLIRMLGLPMHVGVVVAPGRFLHVARGVNTCVERYDSPLWTRRLLGGYRHEAFDHEPASR